jgi:Xaa-Pro aminopeptidase
MLTRRLFLWLPAVGAPRLIIHNIDRIAGRGFPGDVTVYTTWQELHQSLGELFKGRRLAMEISSENAVPYLDRVPWGVVELLTNLGATVMPSDALVTHFAARWSAVELAEHRRTAETIADIARQTLALVVGQQGEANESDVQRDVQEAFARAGLETEDPPIVAFQAHAADPHYFPTVASSKTLEADQVVLLDLWARPSANSVWADQTWMGFSGAAPPDKVVTVWETVRNARDAAIDALHSALKAGNTITGAALDRASRDVVDKAGYGEAFVHRTGHSIDSDLHGSGPHLDDFETHDVRELLPGIAFSVEPGIYLDGEFGVRSEINVHIGESDAEVTPASPQVDLILPAG